jgi:hypothetical protein
VVVERIRFDVIRGEVLARQDAAATQLRERLMRLELEAPHAARESR